MVSFIKAENDDIILSVKNSMNFKNREKTTGMGNVIIANIAKMINAKPEIIRSAEAATYEIKIRFKNLWKSETAEYADFDESLLKKKHKNNYNTINKLIVFEI